VARGQRLADLRTRKVIGIGLLALGQFAVVALAGTSAAIWAGRHLPPRTPEAIAPIMLWFLLGHVFYCRAFAAAGASSSRQAEAPTAAGTLIPPPAPMTMPARMLLGPRSTLGTPGVCRRHARRAVRASSGWPGEPTPEPSCDSAAGSPYARPCGPDRHHA